MIKTILNILTISFTSLFVISCSDGLHPGENFFPSNGTEIVLNKNGGEWTLYVDRMDVSNAVGLNVITNENLGNVWIQVSQMKVPNSALPKDFTIQWTPAGLSCPECTGGLKTWMRRKRH